MHRNRPIPFLVAGLVAVAAATVAFPAASAARPPAPVQPAAVPRDSDALKVAATRDVPEFGGAFLEADGSVHVWMTKPTDAGATRSRTALAAAAGIPAGGGKTVVHRADYTFAQLATWRDAMKGVLALPGVTSLDVDERTNRITVGVESVDRDGPGVTAALARFGVPAAAVSTVQAPAFRMSLGDQTRPLHAGTQIQFSAGLCTLGFPATRVGVTGFVTNSHCSTTRGVVDGGQYWQPTRPVGGAGAVGTETVDTELHPNLFDCPVNRRCASGDANFVATTVGVSQGRIARPPLNSTVWNGTDTYRVTATGFAALNAAVQKVGRTTGRTAGNVTRECVDLNVLNTDITLFCQSTANYQSGPGDSGSPVFRITNAVTNDVTIVGIHWGGSSSGGVNTAAYTPFFEVELEIGNLNVCATGFAC